MILATLENCPPGQDGHGYWGGASGFDFDSEGRPLHKMIKKGIKARVTTRLSSWRSRDLVKPCKQNERNADNQSASESEIWWWKYRLSLLNTIKEHRHQLVCELSSLELMSRKRGFWFTYTSQKKLKEIAREPSALHPEKMRFLNISKTSLYRLLHRFE